MLYKKILILTILVSSNIFSMNPRSNPEAHARREGQNAAENDADLLNRGFSLTQYMAIKLGIQIGSALIVYVGTRFLDLALDRFLPTAQIRQNQLNLAANKIEIDKMNHSFKIQQQKDRLVYFKTYKELIEEQIKEENDETKKEALRSHYKEDQQKFIDQQKNLAFATPAA